MTTAKPIINYWEHKGERFRFTFYDTAYHKGYSPLTQSYAICFREDGKIAIGRHDRDYDEWHIPGGTIEKGESPEEALHRELDEELSIEVGKIKLLGLQKVDYLDRKKRSHYQLRYVAMISKVKTLTPDPDKGILWERKFVDVKDFLKYVPWGNIGEHMLKKAHKQFLRWKDNRMER